MSRRYERSLEFFANFRDGNGISGYRADFRISRFTSTDVTLGAVFEETKVTAQAVRFPFYHTAYLYPILSDSRDQRRNDRYAGEEYDFWGC